MTLTKWAARKRAQRALPTLRGQRCQGQGCDATEDLERHHPDYTNLDRFEILCPPCHILADQRDGHRARRPETTCVVCGDRFRAKERKVCDKPACVSEIRRRASLTRWGANGARSH